MRVKKQESRPWDSSTSNMLFSQAYFVCLDRYFLTFFSPSAPCAPESVNASLVCANNTAEVTWLPSFGAVLYNVTAIGRDGDVKRCSTTTTRCLIPFMHCAQIYGITVTPFSSTCIGIDSTPFQYIAGEEDYNWNKWCFYLIYL